jgi:hypothetical protein
MAITPEQFCSFTFKMSSSRWILAAGSKSAAFNLVRSVVIRWSDSSFLVNETCNDRISSSSDRVVFRNSKNFSTRSSAVSSLFSSKSVFLFFFEEKVLEFDVAGEEKWEKVS